MLNLSHRFASIMVCLLFSFLGILSLSIPDSSAQEENNEIQKIWSSESYVNWTEKITGYSGNLVISVNNNPVAPNKLVLNNYSDTVHVRVPLEYGVSNLITIGNGNQLFFRADVYYAPTYEAELVPEEYEFYPFHTDKNEEPCLACHRMEVQESDILPSSPEESICFPCHKQKFSGLEFQHQSAGVNWECLKCHQPDAVETDYSIDGPVKFTIIEGMAVAPLCYQCHTENKARHSEYKYVHGPVAMQGCIMCHDPHGSNNRNLLQKDTSTMCIECHRLEDMMMKAKVHEPLIKEGCTGCHDPHGSNSLYFLSTDIIGTCYTCHKNIEKLGNNHPITRHPVFGPEDPVNHDRQFTCVSCHNPHSSEFDKFLPVDEMMMLCIRCHISGTM